MLRVSTCDKLCTSKGGTTIDGTYYRVLGVMETASVASMLKIVLTIEDGTAGMANSYTVRDNSRDISWACTGEKTFQESKL